ncbi:MAG: sialidase family protein [Lentisphaeria bacterium]|nr:sialidase family protein [Lentisphaeria bacterium]
MAKLTVVDSGVMYRNPLPGHEAVAAIYPCILPLSEGELFASFRHGQAMCSRDGMIHLLRSVDGGKTWEHEGPLRDRDQDDKPYQYCFGLMTALRDGSILLCDQRADRSDPDRLYVHPEHGGSLPLDFFSMRSTDGGRHWSEPLVANLPPLPEGLVAIASGPVLELADGRWMQLFETFNSYDNDQPFDVQTYVLFSSDEGRNWTDRTTVLDSHAEDRCYLHGHVVPLPDGRLYGLFWSGNIELSEFYDLYSVISSDATGSEWGEPQATGIPGQTSCPVVIADGLMAAIYSHREGTDQPGIKIVLSQDSGKTWELDDPLVVWDAYGKEELGVPRTDSYPSSHDVIAYGAPLLTHLSDNELMASLWCTQGADTHIRCYRLRVDR